jgi:hypothetical protein
MIDAVSRTNKVNRAIRDCLCRCYSSPNSLLGLADYLASLVNSGEWTNNEVAVVRSAAVRILSSISEPEDELCKPMGN